MAQPYKFALYYLWIAPHLLLLAVAALMFARRLYKRFPLFFAYTLYETLVFVLLFSITTLAPAQKDLYRHVFVATLVGSTALRFGILQEIFDNIFQDYPRLEAIATLSMRCVAGLLLVAAFLTALYSEAAASRNVMTGVALLDRSVTVIQSGLLLFLFLFSRLFGLSWRSSTFGIALGFAIFASTEIAVWAVRLMDLTEQEKDLLDLLSTGSYHVSVLVWLGYMLRAEKPVAAAPGVAPLLEQWSGELRSP